MVSKCLLLLIFSAVIEAEYSLSGSCVPIRLEHGRVRRSRSKLVRFTCLPRYELVGNRYATCRNGIWDTPMPVCVRSGCESFSVDNAVQVKTHQGAWVLTLCMPGYRLLGSSAIYCNGMHWNDTFPTCVDTPLTPSLSCDFEKPDLCGWVHDELHDFDWMRINTKTPSSFLETGPTYDHTLGIGENGYYMYIESTSKLENTTARLLSPIYESHLALNGCFSFFYHMYGRGIGGLRIYQKPDSVQLSDLLSLTGNEKSQYLLWELWGNQGNQWFSAAPRLKDFNDNFQIVVEGVRGRSFTSDIAIDDVALLQGENCTNFRLAATTPAPPESASSCLNRCDTTTSRPPSASRRVPAAGTCDCHQWCFTEDRCCPDYLELCVFRTNSTDDDDGSTPAEQSHTQKLVGETTSTTTSTTPPTVTTVITTPKPTTTLTTRRTNPTTVSTTRTTVTTTSTPKPTTQKIEKTTTAKPTTKTTTTKKIVSTITAKQSTTTPTPKFTPTTLRTTTMKTVTDYSSATERDEAKKSEKEIEKEEADKSAKENSLQENGEKTVPKKSSSLKPAVVSVVVLAVFAGLIYLVLVSRTARGREAIARLRGHMASDTSEVRYLNSNDDDL